MEILHHFHDGYRDKNSSREYYVIQYVAAFQHKERTVSAFLSDILHF